MTIHLASGLSNQMLIAMPHLHGDIFVRSLVYMCAHNESGAMGLIVNKPSSITLADLFEQLDIPCSRPELLTRHVLEGGPVQTHIALILHEESSNWQSTQVVGNNLYLTGSKDILEAIANGRGPRKHLVIRGYAGWSGGQLEQEISQNSWLTADVKHTLLFDTPYYARWENAGKLLGFNINLLTDQVGHS